MSKPFRFSGLPKELRLIVYDFLPIQTEHYSIETKWDGWESMPDSPRRSYQSSDILATYNPLYTREGVPKPLLILLHFKFPCLAILRACRWVASEAGAVLQPKLRAMSTLPIRIVVNSWALKSLNLKTILRCFSHSACEAYKDVRVLLCPGHLQKSHNHNDEFCGSGDRLVQIAILNTSADRMIAGNEKSWKKMAGIQSVLYRDLQEDLERYYLYQCSTGELPTRNMGIHVRPALLSTEERAAFEQVRPLDQTTEISATSTTPSLQMAGGEVIEAEEWERDWAESERVLTATDIKSWMATSPWL